MKDRFLNVKTEAANRAEAVALLIRCGYEVYRPEFDAEGVDLVVRTPAEELRPVQLKSGLNVDRDRYGRSDIRIWMLFPLRKYSASCPRNWYLVPHNDLYRWLERKHKGTKISETGKWREQNRVNEPENDLSKFLENWQLTRPTGNRPGL